MQLERIFSIADARRAARRALPAVLFDYVDGAADDEATMRANETAFGDIVFRPRVGRMFQAPDLSVTVLGTTLRSPVMLAPCGLVSFMHPDGASGAARAAARRGTISVLSTAAGSAVGDVVPAAPGSVWFQLYSAGERARADVHIDAARRVGIDVLVVTMDTAAYSKRERDLRHGAQLPLRLDAGSVARLGPQLLVRPRWTWQMLRDGELVTKLRQEEVEGLSKDFLSASPFSWADVAWIRERWAGKLVVKGILVGDDARMAVDHGADAVVVSNHGGRQLDSTAATIRALPEIVAALDGSAEVLLDGGIRRGSHVVKAMALGARAVLIGRPYVWGLAIGGQGGVEHVLSMLDDEITTTLLLLGAQSVSELGRDWVEAA